MITARVVITTFEQNGRHFAGGISSADVVYTLDLNVVINIPADVLKAPSADTVTN